MANQNRSVSEMLTSSMEKIRNMVDVNTVIGRPINVGDGMTIIPVTKVKIGLGGGGSDFARKNSPSADNDLGGLACGINVDPVAFLVVQGDRVRMLPVATPANSTVDRIIEQAPDLLDKVADFLDSRKEAKEAKEEPAAK